MSYEIIEKYIPTSLYPLKSTHTMNPDFITIHNTANDATALNEIAYMTRNTAATSYHFAIDDKHVVQAIPLNRNGWHAGDGQGNGNRKSIGIEICYSKSGGQKYVDAEANTVDYVARLLKQLGWGIDRVKWHRDWSGKNCPHRIFAEGREQSFKERISKRLAELNNPPSEDNELKYSSPTLKKETETSLLSKAHRQIIVDAAVKAGAHSSWSDKLKSNIITDADVLGLAVKYTVAVNK